MLDTSSPVTMLNTFYKEPKLGGYISMVIT